MLKKNLVKSLSGLCVISGFSLIFCCNKNHIEPRFHYAGYSTQCVFSDAFEEGSKHWVVEGQGRVEAAENQRMALVSDSSDLGLVLWTAREFKGDFQIEYTVDFAETSGVHLIFLCASGANGEDIIEDLPPRHGELSEYANGQIQNYYIACHAYSAEGTHVDRSTIRKNPGKLLLSQVPGDPCPDARRYLIDIIKIGGRILFYVDGLLIQDVMDKGGFGPVYDHGRLGLWFQGNAVTYLDGVAVYRLKPQ